MLTGLEDKVAIVTGASSGLGHAFAKALAGQGVRIAACARRLDRLQTLVAEIEAVDGRAMPLHLDVTNVDAIPDAVDAAETELGPISILVNNAGTAVAAPSVELTPEAFDTVMAVNVKAAFFLAREVGKRMIAHGHGGRIINISSMAANKAMPGLAAYGMSKAAVSHMTRTLALEWARERINVNAIAPGWIRTEMNADYLDSEAGREMIADTPRGRYGTPEDPCALLLYLAANESQFVTGQIIGVDDGQSL